MPWRYRIEGVKNISTFSDPAKAIKKAQAKLRTQPCGKQIWVDKIWVYPGSGTISRNKKGVRTIWAHEKPCRGLGKR